MFGRLQPNRLSFVSRRARGENGYDKKEDLLMLVDFA